MLASQEAAQAGGSGAAGPLRPKFKRKDRKPQAWKWQQFTYPARSDGLRLSHWAPASASHQEGEEDSEPSYPFAAFNTTSGIYTYSNDEYAQHLKEDDWTKDDTDHLIDLCQSYDLRFVVIADRWSPPSGRSRTIEDLKARYYAICRRLIRSRISVEDMDSRQQLLATYSFDKPREVERKRLVNKLFTRTPAQLAEEEALYVEARRLEQNEARFASERENLMKLLGGHERIPECELGSIAEAGAGVGMGSIGTLPGTPGAALEEQAALQGDKRKRKRATGEGGDEAAVATASTSKDASAPPTLTSKQKAELKQAHHDELHCITRFDPDSPAPTRPPYPFLIGIPSTTPPIAPSPSNPTSSHGVYLRSTRLLTPRQAQLNRTMQTLAELNPPIGPRLVFPTRTNCEKWEGLLGAVTSGLEMKKGTDRVESELRIARGRLAGLLGEKEKSGAQSSGSGNKRRGSTPRASAPPTRRSNSVSARSRSSRSRTPAVPSASGAAATSAAAGGGDDSMDAGSTVDAAGAANQGQKKRSRSSGGLSDLDDDDEDDDDWKDAHAGAGEDGGQAGQAGEDD